MSNGTQQDAPVTWEQIPAESYSGRSGGTLEVSGIVEGWDAPVTQSVTVSAATIAEVANPAGVATKVAVAPKLPVTTQVTWSNGDVTDEPVIWGEIDPSLLAQPGEVSVSGTVQGWDGQVSCTVTVEALEVVSVEQPADVSTAAGTAPVLPATVRVSWDNGTTTDEPMTWDEVDPVSYHDGGTFTVSGQVGQTGQTASVNVVVAPATPVSAEPVAATTPRGHRAAALPHRTRHLEQRRRHRRAGHLERHRRRALRQRGELRRRGCLRQQRDRLSRRRPT